MPHPRFRHQWEENSYWRHYDNYMEAKMCEKEQEEAATAIAEEKRKKASISRQGTVQGEDGWVVVVSRKNKKVA